MATSIVTRLSSCSYEELFAALNAVGQETQTLEFKESLHPQTIAKQVAAMSNSIGGLIIIGVADPKDGSPLKPTAAPDFQVDEPARRRLRSQIVSRIYPAPDFEVYSFTAKNGAVMIAAEVRESRNAPHELTEERGRFLVRRGTETHGLGLRELEGLQRRRDDLAHEITQSVARYPQINLDIEGREPFLAIHLAPQRGGAHTLTMSEQTEIERIVRSLRGLDIDDVETLTDGVLFRSAYPSPLPQSFDENSFRRCHVTSAGALVIRISFDSNPLYYQVPRLLANGFALSRWLVNHLALGPIVSGAFCFSTDRLPTSVTDETYPLRGRGIVPLTLDVWRESLATAFTEA